MPSHPDFECTQCGECCRVSIQATEEDIWRWAVEYRDDILRQVSVHDFFIHPVLEEEGSRCPFLEKLTQDVYICRIYDTKPQACTQFPISRRQAKRIGCPGVDKLRVGFPGS